MLGNLPLHNWLQWLKLFDNISKFLQQRLIHLDKNWKIKREFWDEIKKAKKKLLAKKFTAQLGFEKSMLLNGRFKETDVISSNE